MLLKPFTFVPIVLQYVAARTCDAPSSDTPAEVSGYTLVNNWNGANMFEEFDFLTGEDPTHGYVDYVDSAEAKTEGLVSIKGKQIYLGADNTNVAAGRGRKSVRLESQAAFNDGLFIIDLEHMPAGCGTWPAFWMLGPNWPGGGSLT